MQLSFVRKSVIVLAMSFLSIAPLSRAHALVGGVLSFATAGAATPVLVAGGILLGGGLATMTAGGWVWLGCSVGPWSPPCGPGPKAATWSGVGAALAGILLLGPEQQLTFQPLVPTSAFELGVTAEEAEAFNSEIEEVHVLGEELGRWFSQMGEEFTSERTEELRVYYSELFSGLRPETRRALDKIISRAWLGNRATGP